MKISIVLGSENENRLMLRMKIEQVLLNLFLIIRDSSITLFGGITHLTQ